MTSQNGKDRHKAQEEEIAEGVLLEALAKAIKPRTCLRASGLAQRAPGDEEDGDRAERGADDRGDAAHEPAEQEAAGERQHRAPWQRERHHHRIERDEAEERARISWRR